jgi:glycosyltransferase involved in cell wall biosynthesis
MIGLKALPYPGGIETVIGELGSRLVDRGHTVTAYVRPRFAQEKAGEHRGIRLEQVPSLCGKNVDTFSYAALATLMVASSGADLVHYHATGVSVFSWLPRVLGKPTLVQSHGLDWRRAKWGRLAKLYLRASDYSTARFPSVTTVVSRVLEKHYRSRYGKPVVYIPNGVPQVCHRPPDRIHELGLRGNDYILFAARLVPEKGCHVLVEAFDRIRPHGLKLVIAGDSHDGDRYASELKRRGDRDILFLGFVRGPLLEELLGNCRIFVLPSEIEGLSTGLLEAMSHGACVLASDIEENREALGEAGYYFRAGDANNLAEQIAFLAASPERVRQAGMEAQRRARGLSNWDDVTDQYEALYMRMLGRN